MENATPRKKVTAPSILAAKGGPKIKMVTAYDYPTAVIADRAGADIILVGDSLANVVLGHDDTLSVDLDVMIHHTAAVSRANPAALVLGDMPWLSYHVSTADAVANAGRMVRKGGAEALKVEGGRKRLDVIKGILDAEIPVMGHLGLTPQSVHAMGGYKVQGKATEAARDLIRDAIALADAGVFAMVLEGVPSLVAEIITKEVSVPTVGIGAGSHTDGQVLVFHDVLGLHDGHLPKFVRQYARLQDGAIEALSEFFADVEKGTFPLDDETYSMSEEAARALLRDEPRGDAFDAF
ncbi:MAG: 3-methyl-2-oxobutanoate hydroxymethyltransferase [Acidimicrobiia bacterium]|nr:3-methyl-2-oxobutanoate hydroxymethyltransferase [Acidimicrobiia bacterium]